MRVCAHWRRSAHASQRSQDFSLVRVVVPSQEGILPPSTYRGLKMIKAGSSLIQGGLRGSPAGKPLGA